MTVILFTLAIVAAVVAMGARRVRRARRLRASRPGGSAASAIPVRAYTEIDDYLAALACACGGSLERMGEGSRADGVHRLRIARLRCYECEREEQVFFETSEVLH